MVDKICKNCGLLKKHESLGLCQNCYSVMMYHKHKTLYIKIRAFFKYYFTCLKCGQSKKYYAKESCKNCYDKQRPKRTRPIKICKNCNKLREYHGRGMCTTCSKKTRPNPKMVICKICNKLKPHQAYGYCNACYLKIWRKKNPNWQNTPERKKYFHEWEQKPEVKLRRKLSALAHPEWRKNSRDNYSKKFQKLVGLNRNQITVKMHQLKADILKRDNNQCQICGNTKSLDAHHIIHKSKEPKLMFNPNNLILLCRDKCHLVVHGKKLNTKIEKIEKNTVFPKYLTL